MWRKGGKKKKEASRTGVPSVASRLIALANQISIMAVAFLAPTHYQKLNPPFTPHPSSLASSLSLKEAPPPKKKGSREKALTQGAGVDGNHLLRPSQPPHLKPAGDFRSMC